MRSYLLFSVSGELRLATLTPFGAEHIPVRWRSADLTRRSASAARQLVELDAEGSMPEVPSSRAALARLFRTDVRAVGMVIV